VNRRTVLALVVALILVVAGTWYVTNLPMFSWYRYASFEQVDGIVISQRAKVDLKNAFLVPTIPTRYELDRGEYRILIWIDPRTHLPRLVVRIESTEGYKLSPAPARAVVANIPRPCGSYGNLSETSDQFEFRWVVCGTGAEPQELVVAFDVTSGGGLVVQENLRFELQKQGFYWIRDSL